MQDSIIKASVFKKLCIIRVYPDDTDYLSFQKSMVQSSPQQYLNKQIKNQSLIVIVWLH